MQDDTTQLVGYVRVSTADQSVALQVKALRDFGVEESWIYTEKASGAKMDRPVLRRVMKLMREGDTLVVWKLDRLGRSVVGVLDAIETLDGRGIKIKSITEGFDTTSPMGRMVMTILLSVAEMERNLIAERTKAGIAAARAEGKVFGQKHSITDNPKRIARLQELFDADRLDSLDARTLMGLLNDADPKAPRIKSPETVRRWRRDGSPGLVVADEKLDDGGSHGG